PPDSQHEIEQRRMNLGRAAGPDVVPGRRGVKADVIGRMLYDLARGKVELRIDLRVGAADGEELVHPHAALADVPEANGSGQQENQAEQEHRARMLAGHGETIRSKMCARIGFDARASGSAYDADPHD